MNRREFFGVLAIGSADISTNLRLSRALRELEASVKLLYGPNVELDIFADESRRMPLLIHAVCV